MVELSNENDKTVYEFLELQRVVVRRDVIVEETAIARTTVYDVLVRLWIKGLIDKRQLNVTKKKGRPPVFWGLSRTWKSYDRWKGNGEVW